MFAVEAYVRFVAEQPPVVAVSSCLTELFALAIRAKERIVGMLENYDFIEDRVLATSAAGWTKRRAMPILPWTTSSATR